MKQKVLLIALCILSIVQTIAIILLANKQIENGKKQDVIRELRKENINLQNENKKINDELKNNKKIIREIKRENRELKEVIESGRKKNRTRSNTRK